MTENAHITVKICYSKYAWEQSNKNLWKYKYSSPILTIMFYISGKIYHWLKFSSMSLGLLIVREAHTSSLIKEEGLWERKMYPSLLELIFAIVRSLESKTMKYKWGYKKHNKFCKEKRESPKGIFEYENITKSIMSWTGSQFKNAKCERCKSV